MKKVVFSVLTALVAGCTLAFAGVGVSYSQVASARVETNSISFKIKRGTTDESVSITKVDGVFKLADDIVLSETHLPIGSAIEPFTDVFDGDGHTITITGDINANAFQGVFGYAEDATFKNVKIVYKDTEQTENVFKTTSIKVPFQAEVSEYYVGSLLGKGKGVTIQSCEVEGNLKLTDVASKVTYGGLVGMVSDVSTIENCCSYINVQSEFNLPNAYTVKFGGIAGEISSSTSKFGIAMADFEFINNSTAVSLDIYEGGIVGNLNGATSIMRNNSASSKVTKTGLNAGDNCYVGGLVGAITNIKPQSGNISSCGYFSSVNGTNNDKFYGNIGIISYEFKNTSTKDYVIQIQEAYMMAQKYYENSQDGEPNEYGMLWCELLPDFDFSSTWIIAGDKAKLQQFQKFEIKLVSQSLDTVYNTLTETNRPTNDIYNYGTEATFYIEFSGNTVDAPSQYQGYYEINDILRKGESVGFADFVEPADSDVVDGKLYSELKAEGTTIKKDENEKYMLKTTLESGIMKFYFSVKAEYSTEGSYSFRTTEIPFTVYITADEGGQIKSGSNVRPSLDPRQLTKNKTLEVSAVSQYQHIFRTWNFYDSISEADYNANLGDEENYFMYEYTDKVSGAVTKTYWKLRTVNLPEILNDANLRLVFGESIFTDSFLLRAMFDKRVYSLNIKDFDSTKMQRVEVTTSNNTQFVFDGNSTNRDFIELDQNETITLKVVMKKGYAVTKDSFPQELRIEMIDKGVVTENEVEYKYYTFSLATSSFRGVVNSQNQMSFEVNAIIDEEKSSSNDSLWLIIGLAGGGVILLAIIIFIIVKVRKGKVPVAKQKNDFDYKNMFR